MHATTNRRSSRSVGTRLMDWLMEGSLGKFVFMLVLALMLAAISHGLSASFASQDRVISAAEANGLENVRPTGHAFFGCGQDFFKEKFEATTANGKPVKGVVCWGILKDATVRIR